MFRQDPADAASPEPEHEWSVAASVQGAVGVTAARRLRLHHLDSHAANAESSFSYPWSVDVLQAMVQGLPADLVH
eukprot:812966-Prorocentrum_lima.AAC.1